MARKQQAQRLEGARRGGRRRLCAAEKWGCTQKVPVLIGLIGGGVALTHSLAHTSTAWCGLPALNNLADWGAALGHAVSGRKRSWHRSALLGGQCYDGCAAAASPAAGASPHSPRRPWPMPLPKNQGGGGGVAAAGQAGRTSAPCHS